MTTLESWRLIFGQEDNSTGPTEIISALINIDCDFEDGTLDAAMEEELRQILRDSPIVKRPEFLAEIQTIRRHEEISPRYWWWWPELLAG